MQTIKKFSFHKKSDLKFDKLDKQTYKLFYQKLLIHGTNPRNPKSI